MVFEQGAVMPYNGFFSPILTILYQFFGSFDCLNHMALEYFVSVINMLLSEPQAGLLNGILFGVKATLSNELKTSLITTGTLHIIALSGMNISILIAVVQTALLPFVSRPIASLLTIFIIIGYILFVGVSPSLVRAALMGCIGLIGIILGRQVWSFMIWVLAVISMLVINLEWLGDISFQLSALATLGIILLGKPSGKIEAPTSLLTWIWSCVASDLRVTLAAQLFTVPILFFQFHRISLISPITNILIGWLIAPTMILGFMAIAASLIWFPLGQIMGWILWVPLTYMVEVIKLTGSVPFASISW